MTLNMPYDEVVKRIASETELSKDEIVNAKVDAGRLVLRPKK